MSKKSQRQGELLHIIKAQGLLPIKTLAAMLQVSEMTIRRDLESLQYQPASPQTPHAAKQTQAKAEGAEKNGNGQYSLLQALQKANEQKNRIGRYAAGLIQAGDVIAIDSGSTTARILPHIAQDKNLTVLCYNANVMLELRHRPGVRLLFCGGVYHPNTEMFESPESISFIRRVRVNKAFISAAGLHQKLGITCANAHEVATKTAVMASSAQRILLVDSEKFGQLRSAYFCQLEDIDCIVTDKLLPLPWQKLIKSKGIKLYMV